MFELLNAVFAAHDLGDFEKEAAILKPKIVSADKQRIKELEALNTALLAELNVYRPKGLRIVRV